MNNLIEKFTNDLTSNNTFFYPCSGQDINTIIKLLDFNENILDINNFILVDLNMNYDHETNDLEMTGYYGLEREEFFFDNKLGLHKLEIIEKEQFDIDEIEILVGDQLKTFRKNSRFIDLVSRVIEPKAIRYKLKYESHEFILYIIHYEATIISEKIKLINTNITTDIPYFGLILFGHARGAFLDDFFINKMIELNPDILNACTYQDLSNFPEYKIFDGAEDIYTKKSIGKERFKVFSALKYV